MRNCTLCSTAPAQAGRATCRRCRYERTKAKKLSADYDTLKPEAFVSAPIGKRDKRYTAEKRQEYSAAMGRFAGGLADDSLDNQDAQFLAALTEQERRYLNRRFARSLSLTTARERLLVAQFTEAAKYLRGSVQAQGYAVKPHTLQRKRVAVLGLSDLHFGADLDGRDNPHSYGEVEERRRLAHAVQSWLDYKPEHRESSAGLLIFNGDLIEGLLGHDARSGAPLTEQKIRFLNAAAQTIQLGAQCFKQLEVVFVPGNHGRNKLRHHGRALVSKWDGFEWFLGYCLQEICAPLRNVTWRLDRKPITIVNLFGSNLGITHSDTAISIGHPDKRAEQNFAAVDKFNTERAYTDRETNAWFFGHYHTARFHAYKRGGLVYNGALIPPNEFAQAMSARSECSQALWEAVEGFPVGDLRFTHVGKAQDTDARLDKILRPVVWK